MFLLEQTLTLNFSNLKPFSKKKAIPKNKDGVFTYKRTNSALNIFTVTVHSQYGMNHHY